LAQFKKTISSKIIADALNKNNFVRLSFQLQQASPANGGVRAEAPASAAGGGEWEDCQMAIHSTLWRIDRRN